MAPCWYVVLSRLAQLPTPSYNNVAGPRGSNQDAIAPATGLSRAHVALILGRLRRRDAVDVQLLHVAGKSRRVRAYRITPWGFKLLSRYDPTPYRAANDN